MINLTCQLLTDLCNTYPFKPVAYSLQTEMRYPFSEYGFVLGYTQDNLRVCVVIDMPYISDNKEFRKNFTYKIVKIPGSLVIILTRASTGTPIRHQLFFGAFLDNATNTSIGFKMPPTIHQMIQLTTCNLNDGRIVTDNKLPRGVFLDVAKAYPFRALFDNPITRTALVEPTRRYNGLKLCKDGKCFTYTYKYIDIQYFIEAKKCCTNFVT